MQLKVITEKLPPEDSDNEILNSLYARAEDFLDTTNATPEISSFQYAARVTDRSHERKNIHPDSDRPSVSSTREDEAQPSSEDGSKSHESSATKIERGKEVIEQFEPGVYVTLVQLRNGTRIFRRVKFRYLTKILVSWHQISPHLGTLTHIDLIKQLLYKYTDI